MYLSLIATVAVAFAPQQGLKGITCPVQGDQVPNASLAIDYSGVRYIMCCAGCVDPFQKDPKKFLTEERMKKQTMGISLFDPISGARIQEKDAKASSDYMGVRWLFASIEDKAAFDKEPKKFAKMPTKEALFCTVMKHPVKSEADAGSYADYEGTRYYFCCTNCLAAFKKDPAQYAKNATSTTEVKAVKAPKG